MRFIWCKPGSFLRKGHKITLTKGFWLGETPVTQQQWESVMKSNPSHFKGAKRPVESVSWENCQKFIASTNEALQCGMRLPTEAEWEYACRAGTTGSYGGTGKLDEMGWHSGNSANETHPVAKKVANNWGFYDMHGNVWEWCADWEGDDLSRIAIDPTGPSSGRYRCQRGGSWAPEGMCVTGYSDCSSSSRNYNSPVNIFWDSGFRVALASL